MTATRIDGKAVAAELRADIAVKVKAFETRARRLATLIECSAAGEKIPGYDIGKKKP